MFDRIGASVQFFFKIQRQRGFQVAYPIRTAGFDAEQLNLEFPNTVGPFVPELMIFDYLDQFAKYSLGLSIGSFWEGKKKRNPKRKAVQTDSVFLEEVMVKAAEFPRVFNEFFALPQAARPDPKSETSHFGPKRKESSKPFEDFPCFFSRAKAKGLDH